MTKSKDKYLLVVSFLEGQNFIRRDRTKFIIEAKFDKEQLVTDPVDHDDTLEINQELAWELDKKALQLHKLQRNCIKANCYAVSETLKEPIGYIVLDVRSASDSEGKAKWYPLLQPKYPKLKPSVQIKLYVEEDTSNDDHQQRLNQMVDHLSQRPSSSLSHRLSAASSLNNSSEGINEVGLRRLKVTLNEEEGFFTIGKSSPNAQVFVLTITIAFAKNLIRLITIPEHNPSANFFFTYEFLNNQVKTKPFGDIVSSQINGERSSIRLCANLDTLKTFFQQQKDLEISFCSSDRILSKCYMNWKLLLEKWTNSLQNFDSPIVIDQLLKFEPTVSSNPGRISPSDSNSAPVIGLQIALDRENINESVFSATADNTKNSSQLNNINHDSNLTANLPPKQPSMQQQQQRKSPALADQAQQPASSHQQHVKFQSETTRPSTEAISQQVKNVPINNAVTNHSDHAVNYITEEMQLKAAYELHLWKETREKEFEQELKKIEAKNFQALAEAFKQHDIERELLIQKKMKEYSDLEVLLKNSLNEVEKREKQLAMNEAQVARIKVDLQHEYENKLLELREASKRVQENADHQVHLQRIKCDNLEEEICRNKKQIYDWEKKYTDKEAEFARHKEREGNRPEIRLQSELNLLNLEKIETERKLVEMTKAKNHYKDQWTRALQEITMIKKKEEANAKAMLKKQQLELEHLRLRYLAAEEKELIKSDEKQLLSLKNELEKMKLSNDSQQLRSASEYDLRFTSSIPMHAETKNGGSSNHLHDSNLHEHTNRLIEERDTLLRTGVYSNSDAIIIELDRRIRDCLKEAKSQK